MNTPTLAQIAQRKRDQKLKAVLRKISDGRAALECKHLNRMVRNGYVPPTEAELLMGNARNHNAVQTTTTGA